MKVKKRLPQDKTGKKNNYDNFRSFVVLTLCTVLAIVMAVGSRLTLDGKGGKVYAASEDAAAVLADENVYDLPMGIAGVVSGVEDAPEPGTQVQRIGISCEQVMVGQRVRTVEEPATTINVSESMESKVNDLDSTAVSLAMNAKMMTDEDYQNLLKIVEAEAGGEDLKGRIMVANVIMNRVGNEEFPGTVTDVIFEYDHGVPQFSPVYDGRIYDVTVSDLTREAVKQALEGVDYSEGALFFIQKSAAEKQSVEWFEKELKRLFQHGVHEFYTYPEKGEQMKTEPGEKKKTEEKKRDTDSVETVQMVKNDIVE